jgi:hypothetical protein
VTAGVTKLEALQPLVEAMDSVRVFKGRGDFLAHNAVALKRMGKQEERGVGKSGECQ